MDHTQLLEEVRKHAHVEISMDGLPVPFQAAIKAASKFIAAEYFKTLNVPVHRERNIDRLCDLLIDHDPNSIIGRAYGTDEEFKGLDANAAIDKCIKKLKDLSDDHKYKDITDAQYIDSVKELTRRLFKINEKKLTEIQTDGSSCATKHDDPALEFILSAKELTLALCHLNQKELEECINYELRMFAKHTKDHEVRTVFDRSLSIWLGSEYVEKGSASHAVWSAISTVGVNYQKEPLSLVHILVDPSGVVFFNEHASFAKPAKAVPEFLRYEGSPSFDVGQRGNREYPYSAVKFLTQFMPPVREIRPDSKYVVPYLNFFKNGDFEVFHFESECKLSDRFHRESSGNILKLPEEIAVLTRPLVLTGNINETPLVYPAGTTCIDGRYILPTEPEKLAKIMQFYSGLKPCVLEIPFLKKRFYK